ncbi:MAG: glycoside hydrolase family 127 protein [Verrucomicrobia bacterium]|nr:glycoside hydrolase family 127 protein [Verrucomicrobiota bacterium]
MKTNTPNRHACQIVSIAGLLWCAAHAVETPATDATERVNLAQVATPSASFVSGDTTVAALNDGENPRNSRDNHSGCYGNWNRTGTQWVQYDWSQPISTRKIEVYWWADGSGVHLPKACRLTYWNGTAFVPVSKPAGLGVAGDTYNSTTFDEVTTSKLRLEIDGADRASTGILEWKVEDAGKSPKFPPTVIADIDRVVMLGGKTWLNAKVKGLQAKASPTLTWTKVSGPGAVTFDNPAAAATTAGFSETGAYVLKLTAADGGLSSSDNVKVKVMARPPVVQLDAVNTKTFKINSPLWNSRIKALVVNWIPHCISECNNHQLSQGGIDNFEEAAKALAGKPHGRHKGYPFSNAWVHQTVEAICIALMIDPQGDQDIIKAQQLMKATLDDWIPKILATQEADGYMQTRFTLDPGARHWDARTRTEHEGYVAGYFLESAINHYLMTDRKDARMYHAAKKLADCWFNNLGPAPKKEWFDGHQEMEQALVRFGRFVNAMEGPGKGQNYIDLAKFLLDCRKSGGEYDQSHLPVVQQYEAVGHAVRAVYNYSAMADVATETHDIDYQSAVMSLWDNMVNKKYYVTGGVGSGETSEGFGPNYSLRNNAYCESCSSCGMIFFQYKLNLAYQDSKFADLYEETLYNALLGSIDLEGKNFCYTNPLDVDGPRTPWHGCPCCVGNIPRTLLMLPTWMYARSADSIYLNLFIGSTATVEGIAGTDVEMVQATNYPWDGKVSITVNPATPKTFTVKVRIPKRDVSELYPSSPDANGVTSIALNGKTVTPDLDKGYAVFNRAWQAGDKIEMVLPMMIQRVKASDRIAADRGRVALRYGPLMYNFESVDQDLTGILNPNTPLVTEWKPDLLKAVNGAPEGVIVIKGAFANGTPLLAIPNYARNNRKVGSPSVVWIKDQ